MLALHVAALHESLLAQLTQYSGFVMTTVHSLEHYQQLPQPIAWLLLSADAGLVAQVAAVHHVAHLQAEERLVLYIGERDSLVLLAQPAENRVEALPAALQPWTSVHSHQPIDALETMLQLLESLHSAGMMYTEPWSGLWKVFQSRWLEWLDNGTLATSWQGRALERYLRLLHRTVNEDTYNITQDLLNIDRLHALVLLLANRLGLAPSTRQLLEHALAVLDADLNLLPSQLSRQQCYELSSLLLSPRPPPEKQSLSAAIFYCVQDYLSQGGTSEALLALRDRLEHYRSEVFMALSQIERDAAIEQAMPTLSGVANGEDILGVLQMAQGLARSGTLVFEAFDAQQSVYGWIGLEHGKIAGIETKHNTGENALFDIVAWDTGRFSLFPVVSVFCDARKRSTDELLMLSATYLDNLRSLQSKNFHSHATIRRLRSDEPPEHLELWQLLAEPKSFVALLSQARSRRWLVDGLAYLAREDRITFEQ